MAKRSTGTAFMVSCTPLKKKKCDNHNYIDDGDDFEGKALLILAPFKPHPKLVFKNVSVGTKSSREILTENPTLKDIEVQFEFVENEKVSSSLIGQWTLSQSRVILSAGTSHSIDVTWTPAQAGLYHISISVKQVGKGNQMRKISQVSISASSIDNKQIKGNRRNVKPLRDKNVDTIKNKNVDYSQVAKQDSKIKTPQKIETSVENDVSKTYTKNKRNVTFDASRTSFTPTNLFRDDSLKVDSLMIKNENLEHEYIIQNETHVLHVSVSDPHILNSETCVLQNETIVHGSTFVTDKIMKAEPCDFESDSLDGSLLSNSFTLSSFNSFEKQLNDINFRSTLDGTFNNGIKSPTTVLKNKNHTVSTTQKHVIPGLKINPPLTSDIRPNKTCSVEDQQKCDNHVIVIKREVEDTSETPFCEGSAFNRSSPRKHMQDYLPQNSKGLWNISPPKRRKVAVTRRTDSSPQVLPPPGMLKNQKSRPTYKTASLKLPKARLNLRRSLESRRLSNFYKKSPKMKDNLINHSPSSTITVNKDFFFDIRLPVNYSKNPFSESFIAFVDARFIDETEKELLKWANVMLSPPLELEAISLMPTEKQILNFSKACVGNSTAHTVQLAKQYKLDFVRKAGRCLLMSSDVVIVLKKVNTAVENELIAIRQDRNLHQDIGLQEIVLKLLLCYHPLWLRIALETIYDQSISLNSNSDIAGIVNFIRKHLLSDNYLKKKYAHPTVPFLMKPDFKDCMKKFILKKFLMVIYFLDVAKRKKLIRHDPCLFCINSPFKMSTAILLEFNKEFIKGGDNSKYLGTFGFRLLHKQTYLEEFDLKLKNRNDLRDGIRLTKLIEIVINYEKGGLYNQLKAPALSRFQKMHNNKIALNAYRNLGQVIDNNVTEVDIINGHREKILSFLWQLRGTALNAAAFSIQIFWKNRKDVIKQRRDFLKTKDAVCKIQNWFRKIKEKNHINKGTNEIPSSDAIVLMRRRKDEIALGKQERARFIHLKITVIKIQRRWKAILAMRNCRTEYLKLKSAVRIVESRRKSMILAKKEKFNFLSLKKCVINFQRRWRALIEMRKCRADFLRLKLTVSCIETHWNATIFARKQRAHFISLKVATVTVQRKWRAILFMRMIKISLSKKQYISRLKSAVKFVEMKRKEEIIKRNSKALATKERAEYLTLKSSVSTLQKKWRAYVAMRKCRTEYLRLKLAVVSIESIRIASVLARKQRADFQALKFAVIVIQRKWRAVFFRRKIKISLANKQRMLQLKSAVLFVEFKRKEVINKRNTQALAVKERAEFFALRACVIMLQRKWRAFLAMRNCRADYIQLKSTVAFIESRREATIMVRKQKAYFIALKHASINLQRKWRAILIFRQERCSYLRLKWAVSFVESMRRTVLDARKERAEFLILKTAVVTTQKRWRALVVMRENRTAYLKLKWAVSFVETKRLAILDTRKEQIEFIALRGATVAIQRRWRAMLIMREKRKEYLQLKHTVTFIEAFRINTLATRTLRLQFIALKSATICLQRKWRAAIAMKKCRNNYLRLKWAVSLLESKRISLLATREVLTQIKLLKQATIILQKRWRASLVMRECRKSFLRKMWAVLIIQNKWRATLTMKKCRSDYLRLKWAVSIIESKRISLLITRKMQTEFQSLKNATRIIQNRWRAVVTMHICRHAYLKIKWAVSFVEVKRFAIIIARQERTKFTKLKVAAIKVQRWWRNKLLLRTNNYELNKRSSNFSPETAAIKIQAFWRGFHLRRKSTMIFKKKFKALEPGKTLGEIRIGLIDKLRKTTTIQMIIHYFQLLDVMTTFSSKLAYDLVQDGMIELLYKLLASFNRNVPDQKAKLHGYIVLVNLTKIKTTCNIVWRVTQACNGFELILSDCISYCKSNRNIFCACVTLLWLWSFQSEKVDVITKHHKFTFAVNKINKEFSTSVKSKLNALTKPDLPSRIPNWGLDKSKCGLKLFSDSQFGWKTLSENFKKN